MYISKVLPEICEIPLILGLRRRLYGSENLSYCYEIISFFFIFGRYPFEQLEVFANWAYNSRFYSHYFQLERALALFNFASGSKLGAQKLGEQFLQWSSKMSMGQKPHQPRIAVDHYLVSSRI